MTPSSASSTAAPQPAPHHKRRSQGAGPELRIVTRTRERNQTITALRAAGKPIAQIARELDLDRRTVRRFARATGEEELQVKTGSVSRCWTATRTTCTGAGPKAAPMPPCSPGSSPPWATATASEPCALTYTRCAPGGLSHHPRQRHRPCARSPAGSCAARHPRPRGAGPSAAGSNCGGSRWGVRSWRQHPTINTKTSAATVSRHCERTRST